MAKITSGKSKQLLIHPTLRNDKIFSNTKLTRKPGYIKQSTLTKDKERKKQKRWPFSVTNKHPERDMLFQVKPGVVIYSKDCNKRKRWR